MVPPSKSHTMRALLFALMGSGTSHIHNFLPSPDTDAMLQAITMLGARIARNDTTLTIVGTGGNFTPCSTIDAGNSGQVLRFIGALCALSPHSFTLTGDLSLRSNRPITPLLHAIEQLGGKASSLETLGFAPVQIQGPIQPGKIEISGMDSQPISGILIAASFLEHPTEVFVKDPHEQAWIDLTLHWLNRFGLSIEHQNYQHYVVPGGLKIQDFSTTIPGDFSSAAFPIVANMITGKTLVLDHLPQDDPQGDKALISLLSQKGAQIDWEGNRITLHRGCFKGGVIDVNPFIDAVPILATLACFGESPTTLINALPARFKESDRLKAMQEELSKMGAHIESTEDTLTIYPSTLQGAILYSHRDHRIAMALCIAALKAKGSSEIYGCDCISKSYPQFQKDFQELGHDIRSSTSDTLWVSGCG